MRSNASDILNLCRPKQWIKNLFVFLPLFFDKQFFNLPHLFYTFITFISFCFLASCIYCINDIIDKESDQKHPIKKNRPIASEKVSIKTAILLGSFLFLLSYGFLFYIPFPNLWKVGICLLIYFFLNLLYSVKLKQIPIIDVFIISLGYVLRVLAGAISVNISVSEWIILMTFLITLFIAFAKRRDDVMILEKQGELRRKSIINFNLQFLNQVLTLVASISIICYIMYTISPEVEQRFDSKNLYLTSIYVIAGIIRYLQITLVNIMSGDPTEILYRDRFIQGCIFFWLLSFFIIIYIL